MQTGLFSSEYDTILTTTLARFYVFAKSIYQKLSLNRSDKTLCEILKKKNSHLYCRKQKMYIDVIYRTARSFFQGRFPKLIISIEYTKNQVEQHKKITFREEL